MTGRYGSAPRPTEDILMATHGTPDSANTKSITTGATAAAATDLMLDTWYRVIATADAFLHFHMTEAATSSHMFVQSDIPEYFYTGAITRISAIQSAGAGTVYLTPMMTNSRVAA